MTLPLSGSITLLDIQNEYGGVNPAGANEYYSGSFYVPPAPDALSVDYDGYGSRQIPASGSISLDAFYGATCPISVFYQGSPSSGTESNLVTRLRYDGTLASVETSAGPVAVARTGSGNAIYGRGVFYNSNQCMTLDHTGAVIGTTTTVGSVADRYGTASCEVGGNAIYRAGGTSGGVAYNRNTRITRDRTLAGVENTTGSSLLGGGAARTAQFGVFHGGSPLLFGTPSPATLAVNSEGQAIFLEVAIGSTSGGWGAVGSFSGGVGLYKSGSTIRRISGLTQVGSDTSLSGTAYGGVPVGKVADRAIAYGGTPDLVIRTNSVDLIEGTTGVRVGSRITVGTARAGAGVVGFDAFDINVYSGGVGVYYGGMDTYPSAAATNRTTVVNASGIGIRTETSIGRARTHLAGGAVSANRGLFWGGVDDAFANTNTLTSIHASGAQMADEITPSATARHGVAGVGDPSGGVLMCYSGTTTSLVVDPRSLTNTVTRFTASGTTGSETSVGTARAAFGGALVGTIGVFYGGGLSALNSTSNTVTRITFSGTLSGSETSVGTNREGTSGAAVGGNGLFYGGGNKVTRISSGGSIVGSETTVGTGRYKPGSADVGGNGLFHGGAYTLGDAFNEVISINASGVQTGITRYVGNFRTNHTGAGLTI